MMPLAFLILVVESRPVQYDTSTLSIRRSAENAREFICGQRCIHRVMTRYFDRQVELAEIVLESESADSLRGLTLAWISTYCNEHGVEATAIQIETSEGELRLQDGSLVILHCKDKPEGHYVLWEQTRNDGNQLIWDGVAGQRLVSSSELRSIASGYGVHIALKGVATKTGIIAIERDYKSPFGFVVIASSVAAVIAVTLTVVLVRKRTVLHASFNRRMENG